jgi:4'-phosphopantetheinyl transferase EntD
MQTRLSPSLQRLQSMADGIVPVGVVAVCGSCDGDISKLFALERVSIQGAVGRRQAEFAAGRSSARAALQQLGLGPLPIMVGEGRAPTWPPGFSGSISHCQSAVIAVAARRSADISYIGIDVEDNLALEAELWPSICTPLELSWLNAHDQPGHWAKVMFSIKEAVYKAHYPSTRKLIDFTGVEIIDLDTAGRFVASLRVGSHMSISGRHTSNEEFVLSFAAF